MSLQQIDDRVVDPATGEIVRAVGDVFDVAEIGNSWYELTPNGLVIHTDPTIEQFVALGEGLLMMGRAWHSWMGDWLIYGKSRQDWGEMYTQALDVSGREYHTLTKAVSFALKIPSEYRRLDAVAYSTHLELKKLSKGPGDRKGHEKIKRWLDYVEENKTTGKDVGRLTRVFDDPPRLDEVDRYSDHQREVLVDLGIVRDEDQPVAVIEVQHNVPWNERARVVLEKVAEVWPDPPDLALYEEVLSVLHA